MLVRYGTARVVRKDVELQRSASLPRMRRHSDWGGAAGMAAAGSTLLSEAASLRIIALICVQAVPHLPTKVCMCRAGSIALAQAAVAAAHYGMLQEAIGAAACPRPELAYSACSVRMQLRCI